MNMHLIDWAIVTALIIFLIIIAIVSKKYMRSVSDFLAANRCAGRYMLTVSEGMAGLGAITILGQFEIYYRAGFVPVWWSLMMSPIGFIVALSGWIIYRFRQTRAFTMAQFFEMRYSKNFRIFAGMLAFVAGILNFGIFPAVGARFFLYFCGFPEYVGFLGFDISVFALIMFILLSLSLYFTFSGGQITVLLTDFFQGIFCNIVFLVIIILVLSIFNWSDIIGAMSDTPPDASLINPFHTSKVKDFNVWYYIIAAFGAFYTHMSWQGNQGHNCSAKSPHEARMGRILGGVRYQSLWLLMCILPIAAYTLMHSSAFASQAEAVRAVIGNIENPSIQEQMTVPVAVGQFLPVGLTGAFCAVILAAFISTHDTYLHSWGCIFIQDVIMPFRKKRFSPEKHIKILRFAIILVALFIYFFSLWFRQTENIVLYLAITGAIFTGGSGSVIIGGLYWKKGTTSAAWSSMISGSSIAVSGIVIRQINPDFPINSQVIWLIGMLISAVVYITVSLLTCKKHFDMDKLLNRTENIEESQVSKSFSQKCLEKLGVTDEFTKGDKAIYFSSIFWVISWVVIFLFGVLCNWIFEVTDDVWVKYWHFNVYLGLTLAIGTTIWLTIGGVKDIKEMFRMLRSSGRDDNDDGMLVETYDKQKKC